MRFAKASASAALGLALWFAAAPGTLAQSNPPPNLPARVKNTLQGGNPPPPQTAAPAQQKAPDSAAPKSQAPKKPAAKAPAKPAPTNAGAQAPPKAPAPAAKQPAPTKQAAPAKQTASATKAPAKTQAEKKPAAPAKKPAAAAAQAKKEMKPAPKPAMRKESAEPPAMTKVARRDPFASLVQKSGKTGPQIPDNLPPGKAGLVISTLRIDGIVRGPNGMIAIVSNHLQRTYFLREGDQLWDGRVVKITMDAVQFHETGRDAFGKPVDRQVTKSLYPRAGEPQ